MDKSWTIILIHSFLLNFMKTKRWNDASILCGGSKWSSCRMRLLVPCLAPWSPQTARRKNRDASKPSSHGSENLISNISYLAGFWRWCITLRISGSVDFVHRSEFEISENSSFRKLDLFASSGEGNETLTLLDPSERTKLNHRTRQLETDSVSETLFSSNLVRLATSINPVILMSS